MIGVWSAFTISLKSFKGNAYLTVKVILCDFVSWRLGGGGLRLET